MADPRLPARAMRLGHNPLARAMAAPAWWAWSVGALLAASAVVACRDSNAPPAGIRVSLNVVTGTPKIEVDDQGFTTITCGVSLEAVASGKGSATWESGALLFYIGRDRSEPEDTIPLSAEEVSSMFEAPGMSAERTRRITFFITADAPFAVGFAFDYRDDEGGDVRTAEITVTCGPEVPATGGPPVISAMTVQPSAGAEAGQSISVTFTAQSQVGIVGAEVTLSGACEATRREAVLLEKAVTRTIVIRAPDTCRPDRLIEIALTVFDGSRDLATRQTSIKVLDVTAPTISPRFYPANGGTPVMELAGDFLPDDTIAVNYNAEDVGGGVAALRWEVLPSGVQGSILLPPSGYPGPRDIVKIPVRSTWGTGPIQLRLWVRDYAGLLSNFYTSTPGAVRIIAPAPTPLSSVRGGSSESATRITE